MSNIKPCPFCGSYNNHLSYCYDSIDNVPLYTINCAECNARSGVYDKMSAIKVWNTRANDNSKCVNALELLSDIDEKECSTAAWDSICNAINMLKN